jgi:hypothetical protein
MFPGRQNEVPKMALYAARAGKGMSIEESLYEDGLTMS